MFRRTIRGQMVQAILRAAETASFMAARGIYRARMRMAHFTLTRSVSEDVLCLLADASGECPLLPRAVYQAVVAPVDQHLPTDFADCGAERFVVAKKSHGRPEPRIVIPMPAPQIRPGFGRWSGLKTIAVVMRMSQRDGKRLMPHAILSAVWQGM